MDNLKCYRDSVGIFKISYSVGFIVKIYCFFVRNLNFKDFFKFFLFNKLYGFYCKNVLCCLGFISFIILFEKSDRNVWW